MKATAALNLLTNLAVLGVAAYIVKVRLVDSPPTTGLANAPATLDLSAEEWAQLTVGGQRLGSRAAEPFMIEFTDYECPYCARVEPMVERYLRGHPERAVIVRQFPLSMHLSAEAAARSALCAAHLGRFSSMHEALFHNRDWRTAHDWARVAMRAGIRDTATFDRCLHSKQTDAALSSDRALATEFGVRATPTFISRHREYVGSLTRWDLARLASADSSR